jgi:hypothetical protein
MILTNTNKNLLQSKSISSKVYVPGISLILAYHSGDSLPVESYDNLGSKHLACLVGQE